MKQYNVFVCSICKSCDEDKDERYILMQVDDITRLTMIHRLPGPRQSDEFFSLKTEVKRKSGGNKIKGTI